MRAVVSAVLHVIMVVAVAVAQPFDYDALDYGLGFGSRHPPTPILEQSFQMMHDGTHRWSFQSGDGTSRWEEADWTGGVRGGFQYADEEGGAAMSYVADEHGFQPSGSAVHPDIVRAVALQVAKAREEPEGMYDQRGFPVHGYGYYSDY